MGFNVNKSNQLLSVFKKQYIHKSHYNNGLEPESILVYFERTGLVPKKQKYKFTNYSTTNTDITNCLLRKYYVSLRVEFSYKYVMKYLRTLTFNNLLSKEALFITF